MVGYVVVVVVDWENCLWQFMVYGWFIWWENAGLRIIRVVVFFFSFEDVT